MSEIFTEWLPANYIELAGAILGILYIIFSIRQNILTWPAGLATSILYVVVFFQSKFYADMGLQFYYIIISIYGWYLWLKGSPRNHTEPLPVTKLTKKQFFTGVPVTAAIFIFIYVILKYYTDSPVPVMDSATTALSVVATYMLARKILEHWIIWIVVDLVSAGLYIYKGLWPTVVLFLVYTVLAFIGLREWKKSYQTYRK